jgi:uncharacterized membrane protein YphA (DoxX/SURF4 family)
MKQNTRFLTALRLLVGAMVVLYSISVLSEMNQSFSNETQRYQQDYPDAIRSGLSLGYAVGKVLFIAGTISGLVGGILTSLGKGRGLIAMSAAAPLIGVAAYLNAPQSTYPSVEPIASEILWCATSAAWASAVALAWGFKHFRIVPGSTT